MIAAARTIAVTMGALVALASAGCGGQQFTAEEFVDEANSHDASLALGAELESLREGVTLYELRFDDHDEGGGGHDHAGGTLVVADDDEEALAEYERCGQSATLVCYRAANVAFYFEGAPAPEDSARLDAALRSMAEG